jgi:peptidoglycan/xylan/chitin deacetylase (PgdA/CDA1 family)
MILMYHKVDIITPSRWWVSVQRFEHQIDLLKGLDVVYLDQFEPGNKSQAVITFDDAYENVYRHAFPILRQRHLPFEVFVTSDVLSDWNDFDASEVMTRFCSRQQLQEMADGGGRMQWHTRSHRRMTKLSDEEIERELEIPDELRSIWPQPHFRWFSYPYGKHDEGIVAHVTDRFSGAVSVVDGSAHDRYQLNRVEVTQDWQPVQVVKRS